MINKAYEYIKRVIKENYKYILFFIATYLILTFPLNYYVIIGGGTIDINDRVKVTNAHKQKGSLNFSYVEELKGTISTYLLSYIIPSWERESLEDYKYDKTENIENITFRNKLELKNANNNAIYVAYIKANKKIEIKNTNYYITYIAKNADTTLKVGDELLEVDNKKITSLDNYKKYINSKKPGNKVTLTIIRNNKKDTATAIIYKDGEKLLSGISILELNNYKTTPKVNLSFKDSESGPSGGLMLTLQIYNKLTANDLTKNRIIVGTGTIDKNGNVGEIGGVKYKLMGAVDKKADIFICPKENLKEAIEEKKKHNYNIKIIGVKGFDKVIEKLNK